MCLEFSRVPLAPLRQAYDWYSFNIIPTIGQVNDSTKWVLGRGDSTILLV